jgi:SagB-type dehydrogenase family enzyme
MDKKHVAEVYHQETKYHEREMFRYQKRLDFSHQPSQYKAYHTEKKIAMSPYLPFQSNIFTGEEKPQKIAAWEEGVPFGIGHLSRLLYFTNGITGILRYPDGQSTTLRAAPTAGGLFPTEIYIAVRSVSYLTDGIYNFQVRDHSLILVWEGDYWSAFQKYCMEHEAIAQSNLLVILTAIYQRSTWRYSERGYRRILLDTGHVLGNLTAYAPQEGFTPYPIGGFFDASLNSLLLLDPMEEGVLSVVALPQNNKVDPGKIHVKSALASRGSYPSQGSDPSGGSHPSEGAVENPLQPLHGPPSYGLQPARSASQSWLYSEKRALQLHLASSITEGIKDDVITVPSPPPSPTPVEREDKNRTALSGGSIVWPDGVGQTILMRRSTRSFTGKALLQEELASILEYAYQPVLETPASFFSPSLLTTYLVIQKMVGLETGVYLYTPQTKEVTLLQSGRFHVETTHFCLGQELAQDAAALVIHTAHLPTALSQYGDRCYRYLHLDAGHIGERMNLAAIQMGLGVSGIGGFYDDEVNALLGLSLDTIIVYITALGRAQDD